jgi:DNA mismatch repair protein MutS2
VGFYQRKNAELQKSERNLTRLTEEYRQKLERVREEEKQIREEAYRDAQIVMTEANAAVERIIAQIRKDQASKAVIKEAHQALDRQSARIKKRLEDFSPPPDSASPSYGVGDGVWVESLQADGEVIAKVSGRGRYKVRVGNLTMELPGTDLRASQAPVKSKPRSGAGVDAGKVYSDQAVNEVDLRGLLAEEAIAKLEKFLDRAMLAGLNTLWVIHGKGTGVLRKRVGEYLKDFPGVKGYRLGAWNEGGDGVTVVELE